MENDKREIAVNSESLLSDIQDAFSICYPFLLMEFFRKSRSLAPLRQIRLEPLGNIKALDDPAASHVIDVGSLRTVAEVAQEIAGITGAVVKISRKSGSVWNVISLTDGWTLERQNAAGEYISRLMAGSKQ